MYLFLSFLRDALFISGIVMIVYAFFFIASSIWLSIILIYVIEDNSQILTVLILWIVSFMTCAMVKCAIHGAKRNDLVLQILFSLGSIFHFTLSLSLLLLETESNQQLIFLVITIIFGIIIILTFCLICNPDNQLRKKKKGKINVNDLQKQNLIEDEIQY